LDTFGLVVSTCTAIPGDSVGRSELVAEPAARAYLLWGDDGFSRDDVVRSFKTRMQARAAGDLNLSEFHAPELNARQLIDACNTVPFIDDRRLVIVYQLFSWRPRVA